MGHAGCSFGEGKRSLLKKRTKKLLHIGCGSPERLSPGFKSFLLLFFKKEVLSYGP
jgi:hypothetical protein